MRLLKLLAVAFTIFAISACDSLDRIVWSPDGTKVAVLAYSGIKFGDATGALSQSTDVKADLFRWLPDGKRAVVVVEEKNASWDNIKPLLLQKDAERAVFLGENLWNFHGNLDTWKYKEESVIYGIHAYLCHKYGTDAANAKLKELGASPTPDSSYGTSIYSVKVINVDQNSADKAPVLLQTVQEINDIRVSPSGKLVLVSEGTGSRGTELRMAFVDGRKSEYLQGSTSHYPDWTADGNSILFASANRPASLEGEVSGTIPIGMLMRQTISYENSLLKLSPAELQCYLPFSDETRVRAMPDGSVILNATAYQLPCMTTSFYDPVKTLYRLSADGKSISPLSLTGDALGNDLSHFEINKDGTYAVVPDNSGGVTLLSLSTGKVTCLEKAPEKQYGSELKFNPSWRNSSELCFGHRVSATQLDVVLQSVNKPEQRVISTNWPLSEIGFLTDPKNQKQSQPRHE